MVPLSQISRVHDPDADLLPWCLVADTDQLDLLAALEFLVFFLFLLILLDFHLSE